MKSADRLRIAKLASGGDERSVIEARCETISRSTAALGLLNPLRYYGSLLDRLVALPDAAQPPMCALVNRICERARATGVLSKGMENGALLS